MRCAGTDYKFNTSSKLTYSGGKINGSWSETTYDAAGQRERDGERQYGARDHQRR